MSPQAIKTITVHELKSKMDAQPRLCLIDVRELYEWQEFHIPGAVLIPKDQISTDIGTKVTDKNQPIYLHCKGGVRSLHAAQNLLDLGYTEVYSVDGGIVAWATSGYPVKEGS